VFRGSFGEAKTGVARPDTAEPRGKSLSELPVGTRAAIERLEGGPAFVSRLVALGFTTGTEVDVVRNSGRGPIIVSLRGTRVALGRGEAAKVMVADAAHAAR
jgi:Fe2+ transport system protein FeoA